MLKVESLTAGYGKKSVLKGVTIEFHPGTLYGIIGPNGAGKTTLIKAISQQLNYQGKISINNTNLRQLPEKERARLMGLLWQTPTIHFPFTVYESVLMGRYPYLNGVYSTFSQNDYHIVEEALKELDLFPLKERPIDALSGGQLQRVFLARLIAQAPAIVIMDEPSNHLDLRHQIEILEKVSRWAKEEGRLVIITLHDLTIVNRYCDRVILIDKGEILSEGVPQKILKSKQIIDSYQVDIPRWMQKVTKLWSE